MKALEFHTKIKNNRIQIPTSIQNELSSNKELDVRVIVLIEDVEIGEDLIIQKASSEEFLNGYSDSDSIYDEY